MDTVDAAVKLLNSAVSKSGAKNKKLLVEMAGQATTHLVLLKLSSISEQVTEKLCNFFRASFFTLYAGLIVPTLRLVSAIFETVYHERILSAMGSGQAEQKGRWESVLHALLGGVLDFLDDHHTTEAKDAIGDILLPTLSDICFSLSAPRTSVDLRCTGYNILIDSAALHQENQEKLRDSKVLGGERLGSCIWRTKDYLALECLLNLFARILPSTNASTSGRERRTAFVQSVFLRTAPPESSTTGREIADLLERVSSSDWDETSLKLVNVMARCSIIYPQPFDVNEVVIGGTIYPSDRLYADDKTFLINVVLEQEDQYESLEIAYMAISKIRLSRSSAGRIHVILSLTSSPRLGKNLVEISIGAVAGFSLSIEDECRLLQALKSRGLAEMVTTESPMFQKLSIATEPAKLEIDSAGRLVKEPTQHERIENLSQFYRTDEKSDDILSAGDWEAFCPIEITSSSVGPANVAIPGSNHEEEGRKCDYPERLASPTKSPPGSGALNLASTDSKLLFDAAFGTSDDDLSEFTDEESPLPRSKILRRTSTTTSIAGRISFEPAHGKAALQPTHLAGGGVGKVVLDSDDEAPPVPVQKRSRNAKKALTRAPTMDTIATEDCVTPLPGPEATTTSDVSTPSSETKGEVLVPATTSGRRSTTSKVLRFSDVHIPAPDFNAALSSPPTVPTSTLKSALVKKPPNARSSLVQESSLSPCISAATAAAKKSAAVKVNDVLDDLIPASSSPTPGAKLGEVSPRKNDQPIADLPLVQHVKRKAATVMESDDDDDVPLATRKAAAARPTKRARSSPGKSPVTPKPTAVPRAKESSPKQHSDQNYPALRPPMHPRRRYHARKGRASSPQPAPSNSPTPAPVSRGNFVDVDYDELPTSPPRRSAASGAAGKSSSPPPKTKLEPVKKDAKAKDAVKDEGVGKVEKATKQTSETKKVKSGNAVKAEKAIKPAKTEKTAKVDAANTLPEHPTQRGKAETSRAGKTAQKDNTTSKVPTTTKIRARKPGNSAKVDELANKNGLEDEVAANGPPRAPPRPRRAGAGATKAKEDAAKSATVIATEPDSVEVSPPLERTTARTYEEDTSIAAADAYETADIAIVVTDDATSSGILEFAFLDDVQPPQPEIVFSDPSIVDNSTEVARSSSSKSAASKPKPPKPRPVETPWDAMAQFIQQPPRSAADSPPQAELVAVLAEDHAKAPALSAPTPVDFSTATYAKFALTSTVSTRAGKRETAVQTTGATTSPTLQVERKPVVIDLTLDSSPEPVRKPARAKVTPVCSPHKNLNTTASAVLEDALCPQEHVHTAKERLPQPVQHPHTVRFTSPTEPPSMHGRSAFRPGKYNDHMCLFANAYWHCDTGRNREGTAEAGDETLVDIDCGSGDPGLDAIVDVLNKLHRVVVESIASKFEGVRQEVRAGRDELLHFATADLHTLHGQSVTHFNRLIDLEAEYATVGRNVLYANEDWVNVDQQACDTLAAVVEKHDRGTLSKQMPATLVTLKL
ncbi:hypothetical protein V8D89_005734 [Ganoderma adspersum]